MVKKGHGGALRSKFKANLVYTKSNRISRATERPFLRERERESDRRKGGRRIG